MEFDPHLHDLVRAQPMIFTPLSKLYKLLKTNINLNKFKKHLNPWQYCHIFFIQSNNTYHWLYLQSAAIQNIPNLTTLLSPALYFVMKTSPGITNVIQSGNSLSINHWLTNTLTIHWAMDEAGALTSATMLRILDIIRSMLNTLCTSWWHNALLQTMDQQTIRQTTTALLILVFAYLLELDL